jgi:HPt (histidine-containing phosphotransfer) domain-containing protein
MPSSSTVDRCAHSSRGADATRRFLTETDPLIGDLREALTRYDYHAMNRAVRYLRGLSALVNAPRIAAAATRFENAFSRADDANLPAYADQLCSEVVSVQEELRNELQHSPAS